MGKERLKRLRTLFVYQTFNEDSKVSYKTYIEELRQDGYDVEGFSLTLPPYDGWTAYSNIENLYEKRDSLLCKLYSDLINICKEKDIMILYNGGNVHKDILPELKTFNAYFCWDDPESSKYLSEPVAKYFDASFVGNNACLNLYKSWGCKNVFFRPFGVRSRFCGKNITRDTILSRDNTIDISLFCERETSWRSKRLDYLSKNVPGIFARGRGWPGGYVSLDEMLSAYGQSKIGINMHNGIGSFNARLFILPANGVMQICDNKYFLGHIFELGKEVVGFVEIEEVPDLVKYYLAHESERRQIAYNGWKRAMEEYNQVAIWEKQMSQIGGLL